MKLEVVFKGGSNWNKSGKRLYWLIGKVLKGENMPISAVYKKGVIKPLVEVDLKENEKIEIEIKRKKFNPVDSLLGIIKVKDPNVKELIASEEWY